MGTVIITARLMPDAPERDVESWREDVKKAVEGEVLKMEKVPVAFGLNCLKVIFTLPDKEGVMDKTEDALKNIEGVQDVSIIDMSRSLE